MAKSQAPKRKRKGPSLGDVAAMAGVSAQTVSRVATGSDLVSANTRARVQEVMNRLGYIPNPAARALRQGAYKAIAVVTQQLSRLGEIQTTVGIVSAAEKVGYSVTLVQISEPDRADLQASIARLADLPIDGAIIVRIGNVSNDVLTLPPNLPVVVCDSYLAGFYPAALGDQIKGVQDSIQHLLDLGHTNIHHIAGSADSHPAGIRKATFRRTIVAAGLKPGRVWQGDWTIESGYKAGLEIAKDPDVTAVVCGNDEMALGLMRSLLDSGLRVPEDISVVGFDNADLARYTVPPLTTVMQDFHTIGAEVVDKLMRLINGEDVDLEPTFLPTELVVRESTGPVNAERASRKKIA